MNRGKLRRLHASRTSIVLALPLGAMLFFGAARALAAPVTLAPASATAVPPNWPWRGVVMGQVHNTTYGGATAADLAAYYDEFGRTIAYPKGMNSVHLYLDVGKYFDAGCPGISPIGPGCTADFAWTNTMTWLDSMLDEARALNITAIVALNSAEMADGSGYFDYNSSPSLGSPDFWGNTSDVDQLYAQVTKLATHIFNYDQEHAVAHAYDIVVEPHQKPCSGSDPHACQPTDWQSIQENIISTIRASDPKAWVVVKPGPYAGVAGYSQLCPAFCAYTDPRIVYSVHTYDPHSYTHQYIDGVANEMGAPWPGTVYSPSGSSSYYDEGTVFNDLSPIETFMTTRAVAPVYTYVGEFSAVIFACDSNVWMENMDDIWENKMVPSWGWSYFSLGGYQGWSPQYNYTVSAPPPRTNVSYSAPIPTTDTTAATARWHDLLAIFHPSLSNPFPSSEGYCP